MNRFLVTLTLLLIVALNPAPSFGQAFADIERRVIAMEERLRLAYDEMSALKEELGRMRLPGERREAVAVGIGAGDAPSEQQSVPTVPAVGVFGHQVLGVSRLDERTHAVTAKPEIFVQSRFSAFPETEATLNDYAPNFRIPRLSMRWAGRVNERFGAGVELQYRSAPDGVPDQLVNDAYIDYYATPAVMIRAGQFVKPFGFDVQQPDADRELPERAMVADYVFPGSRDRGIMVHGSLDALCARCSGVNYYAAAMNGNRFFKDSNRRLNYLLRVRKTTDTVAFGGSMQLGTQVTPPGVAQTNDENVFGADAQWTVGRLGLRGEFVHANRPSTLLSREPLFVPAFVAGPRVRTVGTSVTGLWSITADRQAYIRFDRLGGDIVQLCPDQKDGSCKINAANVGIRQRVGGNGFVGMDLQWKGRLSFNQDAVNTRLHVTSSLLF